MLGDDPPLDVVGTAGRIIDDHGQRLALVELGKGVVGQSPRGNQGDAGDGEHSSGHRSILC
jgi:hypothetical protein